MPSSHPLRWILVPLCLGLAGYGCAGTETQQGESGSLSLDLVLAGGVEIDVVDWEITGNDMDMGGSIDVSASGSTASVEVFGLPEGPEPYVVELSAVSVDQEVTCRGSAEFDVEVGVSTQVMVMLNCKRQDQLGAVRVNGKFNICSELTKVVVSPLQTSVGNDISLVSAAVDEEGDPISYMWSSHSGSLADPTAASTSYTCTEIGDDDITILVSDDGGSYCMSMWTVRVTCVVGGANPCDDVTCEDDGNECTSEACNPGTGACESSPVDDGTGCDDDAGVCMDGECVPNDLCMDVVCEDDGNECTDEACNPNNGQCETSNNSNACDGGTGTCSAGECVPNDLCMDVVCEDDGNECTDEACNPNNGQCETSNNSDACDGGNGTCSAGECVPNDLCMDVVCEDDGNECTDEACNPNNGECETSNNSNACDGGTGTCNAGVCEPNPECVVGGDCPDTGNECIDPVCNAGVCETSNNTNACDGGAGTCNAGVCEAIAEVFYEQDFNLLPLDPGGVIGDGWNYFINVFADGGATYRFGYAGPAPQGPQISNLVTTEGGAEQEPQQLVVYSDYECCAGDVGHSNPTDLVETNVFQERTIGAADVGKTFTFMFQAKGGNLAGSTTANGFIKTLNPSAGFSESAADRADTTGLPDTWGGFTVSLFVDGTTVAIGHILQFGFQTNASNGEDSANFYDNVLVNVE